MRSNIPVYYGVFHFAKMYCELLKRTHLLLSTTEIQLELAVAQNANCKGTPQ